MKNEYIVANDYRANYKPLTIDYKMLKAENLLDAMNEAEQYMDKETVYLLKIMKRSGAAHKVKGVDAREATYTDVLTNRGQWLAQHRCSSLRAALDEPDVDVQQRFC